RNVRMAAVEQAGEPDVGVDRLALRRQDRRARSVDQQGSQVHVAALADAQQLRLASAGVLPGHQSQPGGQLPAVVEAVRIGDRCDQRAGSQGSDPGDLLQLAAEFAAAMPRLYLRLQLVNLPIEFLEMLSQALDQ